MSLPDRRILIIDEGGFSRVCSAILEFEGYGAEAVTGVDNLPSRLDNGEFGLVIMSYPYGAYLLGEIEQRKIPVIILCDHINRELINILEGFNSSYCMIKPLDYQKFRTLVHEVMNEEASVTGGYRIV